MIATINNRMEKRVISTESITPIIEHIKPAVTVEEGCIPIAAAFFFALKAKMIPIIPAISENIPVPDKTIDTIPRIRGRASVPVDV